jgi:hypothetical protein
MGMVVTESDDGTKQRTIEDFKDMENNIIRATAWYMDEVWKWIRDLAVDMCPKDTGALASSIFLGSEGTLVVTSGSQGDFYNNSISAGDPNIINPKTGKATSEYVMFVHDGHLMRDGSFWEGIPFLTYAVAMFEIELEECVDKAIHDLGLDREGT